MRCRHTITCYLYFRTHNDYLCICDLCIQRLEDEVVAEMLWG
jgi:hypothetical protein